MDTNEKLELLRKHMKKKGIHAYIIPSADSHKSEYVSDRYKSRQWLSGFTGSAGTLVVTMDESGLWTDGRYYIQAESELEGSEIKLFKMMEPGVPSYTDWICEKLDENMCVGFDSNVFSVLEVERMQKKFNSFKMDINGECDFLEKIWKDRPSMPMEEVFVHELEYAGITLEQKMDMVRREMDSKGADNYVMSSLDDIAWLFNLRGSDVKNNPVFMSYALIGKDYATLFVEDKKLNKEAKSHLSENGIELKSYSKIEKELSKLDKRSHIFIDPGKLSHRLCGMIPSKCEKLRGDDIVQKLKAVKRTPEIENIKRCQIRDGVAMVKFLFWLDESIGKEELTEISVAEKLKGFRKSQEGFMGVSFDTICAYMDHAAMMHYSASENSQYTLKNQGMLLVDSGGQYLDGTTDITRTIVLGDITGEQKRDFTLVLKGHIALAKLKFLHGATGSNLDVIARQPLWNVGIDYKCGTGHGLGYFLSVHEGPQRISQVLNGVVLEEGMLLTNEPGIYRHGSHGIRTENAMLVKKAEKTEFGQFMEFETISFCPIDIRAIDVDMLTDEERDWINSYHSTVYDKVSSYLEENERSWLEKMTKNI